jgi:hypothetical protein
MSKLELKQGALRLRLEGVGYVFLDESGEVSDKPIAWGFDQYVKQVQTGEIDGELACLLDAIEDYIEHAEKVKLAAARMAGTGVSEGATVGAGELVDALDGSISGPVELALDLSRQGHGCAPVKDGMPSKRMATGTVERQQGAGVVEIERSADGSVLFNAPAALRPATFLDLVDGLDKEGLAYSLEAIREAGGARGRAWALTVDGGDGKVILDLGDDGRWSAQATVTV